MHSLSLIAITMKLLLALSLLKIRGTLGIISRENGDTGPPTVPSNQAVINATAAATLEWVIEFNGGSEQRFHVQYKKSAESWDDATEVPQGVTITDPGPKEVYLASNVWHVFRVASHYSHPGTHASDLNNIASGKTSEKLKTSRTGVKQANNKVTLRWKQVTTSYTVLKIRCCQNGSENCSNYIVKNQTETKAIFFIDVDKTYDFHTMVKNGDDVVYRSFIHIYSHSEMDEDHRKILLAVTGVMVGAVIVAITDAIVAIVLWNRGIVGWGKRRNRGPANGTVDDGWIEFTTTGNESLSCANIGTEHVNDMFHREHTAGQTDYATTYDHFWRSDSDERQEGQEEQEHVGYENVNRPTAWQQVASGSNPVTASQKNQTDYATPYDHFWQNALHERQTGQNNLPDYDTPYEPVHQNVSVGKQMGQEIVEPEGMYNDMRVVVQ
ncbi:uncharacterized protein LOC135502433 [Lineus longissimus]|uniref:uncharacterized protein LOC135502433 n=1 Tax=Lineus longissimus TaxID=88925 RepID=UPI00315D0C65